LNTTSGTSVTGASGANAFIRASLVILRAGSISTTSGVPDSQNPSMNLRARGSCSMQADLPIQFSVSLVGAN
jgi:hypothetical protein